MLEVPQRFWDVAYNGAHFPGAPGTRGLEGGANCQQFAYELLRHFGRKIPDFRSSDLWADELFTRRVETPQPLDLLLFNGNADSYGAHVAVWTGDDKAVHLCAEIGQPALWHLQDFLSRPRYAIWIGTKRLLQ